jgi:hypothetical protein
MLRVSHTSSRTASIRLARVVSHLHQASKELTAATHAAPYRFHHNQLRNLTLDLRELASPIAGLAASLERGGRR